MKIGLFGYPGDPLRQAAESGLRALGHHVVGQVPGAWSEGTAFRDLDAVVVCGLRGPCGAASRFYAKLGVPVVLVDYPHLGRGKGHWRISPPDLAHLPEFPGKAPRDRLEALGIEPQERKRVKGQHVLVLGQRGGDPTHGMSRGEMQAWAEESVQKLRSLTDSKVVWRPHPTEVYEIAGADGFSDPREETIHQAFEGAWLVVTHSSAGGLEALIAGLPVIATGEPPHKGLTHDFSGFKNIAPPAPDELEDLLARVAYTQWSEAEIATGEPFAALLPDPDAVPRTAEASAEIKALMKLEGIGEATAERLHSAGITTRRLWDKAVRLTEIEALELGAPEERSVRLAAGLAEAELEASPPAPPEEPADPEEPEGEAEPDEEPPEPPAPFDPDAEEQRLQAAIPALSNKSVRVVLGNELTLEALSGLSADQVDSLGLAPTQAAALQQWIDSSKGA